MSITSACEVNLGIIWEIWAQMNFIEQLKSSNYMLVVATVGILALFVAVKIGHFLLRIVLGLIALICVAAAIWWFFFRQ
jgi:hypothetical protein